MYENQNYNTKRLKKILKLKKMNARLSHDIDIFLKFNQKSKHREYLETLQKHVRKCASIALFKDTGDIEYITSLCCKDKLCFICNYQRKNLLRKKYMLWLEKNPYFLRQKGTNTIKKCSDVPEHLRDNYHILHYDPMHLTLSVPHANGQYKGQSIYYKAIIQDYNTLRRCEYFKQNVYGGEYGIEATLTKNGLNIHIHSLLFVKRYEQNRNQLHRQILIDWNHITCDARNKSHELTEKVRFAIKKGNKLLTDSDLNQLSPLGATLINLENIYNVDENGNKIYSLNNESAMKAFMETISYHFKPKMFNNIDGSFNVGLLADIYAVTKGMILYRKFGILHGDKSLNLKENGSELDELEVSNEVKELIDESTGEVKILPNAYFATKLLNSYVDENDNIRFKQGSTYKDLQADTTRSAIMELTYKNN